MIGDLVQQGVTQNDFSLTGIVLVGGTIGVLAVFVSWTSFRFPRLRPVLDGEPIIVVQEGKPIKKNLNRNRLTLDELRAAARQEQIASLDDVRVGSSRDERPDQLHPQGGGRLSASQASPTGANDSPMRRDLRVGRSSRTRPLRRSAGVR